MNQLHEQLDRLADGAPHGGRTPAETWSRGVRRGRRRQALAGTAIAATLVVAAAAATSWLPHAGHEPLPGGPAVAGTGLHLPARVDPPSRADAPLPQGPLAAVGLAERTGADGRARLDAFGVSAVDQRSGWLTTDNRDWDAAPELSPDGRWAVWPHLPSEVDPAAMAVLDTTTGEVHTISDPDSMPESAFTGSTTFTADSRYLLAQPLTDQGTSRLVAWDLETGETTVLDDGDSQGGPAFRVVDVLGAPDGAMWLEGEHTQRLSLHRAAVPGGTPTTVATVGSDTESLSYSPDGTVVASISFDPADRMNRVLSVGTSPDDLQQVGSSFDQIQFAGWRDAQHVVVVDNDGDYQVVDTTTGDAQPLDLRGPEVEGSISVAAELWATIGSGS